MDGNLRRSAARTSLATIVRTHRSPQPTAMPSHAQRFLLTLSCYGMAYVLGSALGSGLHAGNLITLTFIGLLCGGLGALWMREPNAWEWPLSLLLGGWIVLDHMGWPARPSPLEWAATLGLILVLVLVSRLAGIGVRRFGQGILPLLRSRFAQTLLALGLLLGVASGSLFAPFSYPLPLARMLAHLWGQPPLVALAVSWLTSAAAMGYAAGFALPRAYALTGLAGLALACAALSLRSIEPWLRSDATGLWLGDAFALPWTIAPAAALAAWLGGRAGRAVGIAREGAA